MLYGKISFVSEENKGSTFTVILKRADALPGSITEQPAVAEELPLSEDLSKYENKQDADLSETVTRDTLLIVEDHDALRYYLRKTFEEDYRLVDVPNAQEALSYLSNEYPDLILSDVMMPGIQGDELCRLIKEDPNTAGIPFILLTAKANHDATVEGLKKGADDYIPKPFSTEILKAKVQTLIDNRNRQKEFFMRQVIKQVEADKSHSNKEEIREVAEAPETCDNKVDEPPTHNLSENDHQFITRATQIIIENISDTDFSINTLCQEMAMSRTLFLQPPQIIDRKRSTGIHPHHTAPQSCRIIKRRKECSHGCYRHRICKYKIF